ncbi:MAG: hypothetical protein ACHQ7H_04725 [Candidatus Rokuibacteriota bacterium]
MDVTVTPHRRTAVVLLAVTLLAGCVSQDYYRATGQSAAAGAMQGVREGIAGIQEPLRQTLHGALVDDPMLKDAARDMTRSAMEVLEARLGSPELRRQVDAHVAQAMASLQRDSDKTVRELVTAAGGTLEAELRRVATASILAATTTLRDSLERDVTPAAQRLASRMGEELVISVVKGLEGPLQKTMLQAGRNMSQALIKGAAEGAEDPINQAGFGGLTNHVMLQAVRGARQGMTEGLPDQAQIALISGMVLLGALVLATSGGLGFFWWRYQQSAKTLTIVAKSINNHQSGALKDTIKKSTHDNYVGPWFSSFLKRRGL